MKKWLKYGLVGFVLGIIISVIAMGYWETSKQGISIILRIFVIGPLELLANVGFGAGSIFVLPFVYFLVGALIGLVVQKIKANR